MKRKIFSKLLMVALVIAAVGSFVSCKDYDDDINNLQKQIDAKAALSELTALQSTLDSKIAAAQSAAQAAQATADAAATKTAVADLKTALEAAIADAKKAGTDAGTQAGNAITAANKAQETADGAAAAAKKADEDAKAALADALKTIAETYETKADAAAKAAEAKEAINAVKEALAAVKATADAAFTKAEAETLQKSVSDLKTELETLQTSLEADIDKKIDDKIKEVNNAVASVDAIWSAVTSVEIYKSMGENGGNQKYVELLLFKGTEVTNTFGADTDAKKEYKEGDEIEFNNELIVRVQPTNATLTKEQVQLINSKGESLIDKGIVKVESVEPYTQLITRASYATGLWKVTVIREEGVKDEDIQKAVAGNKKAGEGKALYALSVAEKDKAERTVNSTFDITVWYGPYVPAVALDFKVNQTPVGNIHNRWTGARGEAEDGTIIFDQKEYRWNDCKKDKGYFIADYPRIYMDTDKKSWAPAVDSMNVADFSAPNYVVDAGDNRKDAPLLIVGLGQEIIISDLNQTTNTKIVDQYGATQQGRVQWYYVTLDADYALESTPSELNIWKEYEKTIEGLNTMTSSNDKLTITINDSRAFGDVIGFRLYAVNYDGTLADPDGKAFYVRVGNEEAPEIAAIDAELATAEIELTKAGAGTKEIVVNNAAEIFKDADFLELVPTSLADEPEIYADGDATTPLAKTGVTTTARPFGINAADIKSTSTKVKVTMKPECLVDNATYTQVYAVKRYTDTHKTATKAEILRYVKFSVKKTIPSAVLPENIPWNLATNIGSGNTVKVFVDDKGTQNGENMYYNTSKKAEVLYYQPKYKVMQSLFSKATLDSLAKHGAGLGLYFDKVDTTHTIVTAAAANVYTDGTLKYTINWAANSTAKQKTPTITTQYGVVAGTAAADAKAFGSAAAGVDILLPSWKTADGTTARDLMVTHAAGEKISRPAGDTGVNQKTPNKGAVEAYKAGASATGIKFIFDRWSNVIDYSKFGTYTDYVAVTGGFNKVQKDIKIEATYGQNWEYFPTTAGTPTGNAGQYRDVLTIDKVIMSNNGYPLANVTSPLTLDQVVAATATPGKFKIANIVVAKDADAKEISQYYKLGTTSTAKYDGTALDNYNKTTTCNAKVGTTATALAAGATTGNLVLEYTPNTSVPAVTSPITEYVVFFLNDNLGTDYDAATATYNWTGATADMTWGTTMGYNTKPYTTKIAIPFTIKPAGSAARAK